MYVGEAVIVGGTRVRVGEAVAFRFGGVDGLAVSAMAVGRSSSGDGVGDDALA